MPRIALPLACRAPLGLAVLTLCALFAVATRIAAGDIHVPDARANAGATIGFPWSQSEVRFQVLVTAVQMGARPVTITDLGFAPAVTGAFQAGQVQIRMAHTTQPLQFLFANNLTKSLTTVHAGAMLWSFQANQWNDVGLNAPFRYNGTDSLVVEIRFIGGQGGPRCYGGSLANYFISGAGAYSATNPGNVLLRVVPKMRFHFNETVIAGSGSPTPGGVVDFALTSPNDGGLAYQVGTSLGTGPIPIDQRRLDLSPDPLLVLSVAGTLPTVFEGYASRLDTTGRAAARLHIPPLPALKGLRIHSAFVTLHTSAPSGVKNISDPFTFTIQ